MDFGYLPSVDRVAFAFPPTSPRSAALLERALADRPVGGDTTVAVRVGLPVWGHSAWAGSLYPARTAPRDFLREYARQFNSIELDSSFYRIPSPATVAAWKRVVPDDFKFYPKFPREISHARNLSLEDPPLLQAFCASVGALGRRLGASFLQLPPHFEPIRLPLLERLLSRLPTDFEIAIEVRHPAWFTRGGGLTPRAHDLFERRGVTAVISDTAGRPDALHMSLTAPRAFVRFQSNARHGELHRSDGERLARWAERISEWRNRGLREVAFFIHNHDLDLAPAVAGVFIEHLRQHAVAGLPGLHAPSAPAGAAPLPTEATQLKLW